MNGNSIYEIKNLSLANDDLILNETIFHYISDFETYFKLITQFNTCRKREFMRL